MKSKLTQKVIDLKKKNNLKMNTELSPYNITNMILQSSFSLPNCRLRVE